MTLVCWSGGADSTLALYLTAKEEGSARAISVVHPNVTSSQEEAVAARKNLLERFKKRGLNVTHSTVTLSQDNYQVQVTRTGKGIVQPLFWLALAVPYLEEQEDLVFGYLKADCFWHCRETFEAAFRHLQKIDGRKGKLRLPLEWLTKAECVKQLQALKLYSLCWYCELPKKGKRCNRCVPCLEHRTALWQLANGMDRHPGDEEKPA